jgi:hypothetical protein
MRSAPNGEQSVDAANCAENQSFRRSLTPLLFINRGNNFLAIPA